MTLVDLLNEERAKKGLCKLEWTPNVYLEGYNSDPDLRDPDVWGGKDADCFVNGKFDPYKLVESTCVLNAAQICADRQQAGHGGVSASCVSETWGYGSLEDNLCEAMKGYMNSPGHYELLMSPGSHRVTAAYAIGKNGHVYTAITCGG